MEHCPILSKKKQNTCKIETLKHVHVIEAVRLLKPIKTALIFKVTVTNLRNYYSLTFDLPNGPQYGDINHVQDCSYNDCS